VSPPKIEEWQRIHKKTPLVSEVEKIPRVGVELTSKNPQVSSNQSVCGLSVSENTQIDAQNIGSTCPRLTKIFNKWETLPESMKAGIEAFVDSYYPDL
jgi:hypothetical protein